MNDRSYSKLFSSIVTSSMWSEDSDTRVVWVTMLALKNEHSEVQSSVPGLARLANVALDKCQFALDKFKAADPYSRTKDFEGRRIEEIPGGWRILNGDAYRRLMSQDERRQYKRVKEAERRARKHAGVDNSVDNECPRVDKRGQNKADTDTDTDTEVQKKKEGSRADAPRVKFKRPDIEQVKLLAAKAGLPETEAFKFFNYYESNGWKVGKNPMQSLGGAMGTWKSRWSESNGNARSPELETEPEREKRLVREALS